MTPQELKNTDKAALILMSLGKERAAEILKHLGEQDAKRVSKALLTINNIDRETQLGVVTEFQKLLKAGDKVVVDGLNFAQSLLANAFGDTGDKTLHDYITGTRKEAISSILADVPEKLLVQFIKAEQPQTIAFLLTKMNAQQAAHVLESLSEEEQSDILLRISRLRAIRSEVLDEVREILLKTIQTAEFVNEETIDGSKTAATLVNKMNKATQERLFKALETQVPEIAHEIRGLLFTFEDLVKLDTKGMRELLKEIPRDQLIIALKKTSQKVSNFFFRNMSTRAVAMLKEELESLGQIKIKDVENAQRKIAETAQRLEAEGTITVNSNDSAESYV
jgi:flagellar motor switch protein FliG